MSLINNAIDGLIGSVVSGSVALVIFLVTRRSRGPKEEKAWQDRAEELTKLVTAQFSNEITYLRRQLQGQADAASKRLDACQEECKRLNRIINRQIRGGDST